jgi:hypothetical protein
MKEEFLIKQNEGGRYTKCVWRVNDVSIIEVTFDTRTLSVVNDKKEQTTALKIWETTLKKVEKKLMEVLPIDGYVESPSVVKRLKTAIATLRGEIDVTPFGNKKVLMVSPDELLERMKAVSKLTKRYNYKLYGMLLIYSELLKEEETSTENNTISSSLIGE